MIIAMFEIEFGDADGGKAREDEAYVQQGLLRIPAMAIVNHIENQGSFMRDCYEHLEATDQQHVATYAMVLIVGLQSVKAERNGDNRALDKDTPPVLPVQLVKLRHGVFLKDVLDPFWQHVSSFWSEKSVEWVEAEHRELFQLYNSDTILCDIINKHDHMTTFNDVWDCAPGQFKCLRSFCGGLMTVLANTTSVESDFSILKWELDENHTTLIHLSLEGIFQAKQRLILQTLLR